MTVCLGHEPHNVNRRHHGDLVGGVAQIASNRRPRRPARRPTGARVRRRWRAASRTTRWCWHDRMSPMPARLSWRRRRLDDRDVEGDQFGHHGADVSNSAIELYPDGVGEPGVDRGDRRDLDQSFSLLPGEKLCGVKRCAPAEADDDLDFARGAMATALEVAISLHVPRGDQSAPAGDQRSRATDHGGSLQQTVRTSSGSKYQVEFVTSETGSPIVGMRLTYVPAVLGADAVPFRSVEREQRVVDRTDHSQRGHRAPRSRYVTGPGGDAIDRGAERLEQVGFEPMPPPSTITQGRSATPVQANARADTAAWRRQRSVRRRHPVRRRRNTAPRTARG